MGTAKGKGKGKVTGTVAVTGKGRGKGAGTVTGNGTKSPRQRIRHGWYLQLVLTTFAKYAVYVNERDHSTDFVF
jgi:hypothetical protein